MTHVSNRAGEVDRFLENLSHPLKAEIEHIRASILGSSDQITERIKWNAPSFCYQGEDRVTLKLHPQDRVQLIFHRGAKVKDPTGFAFEDRSGLLTWLAADRAIVTLRDMNDVETHLSALVAVVNDWMEATSETDSQRR